MRYVFSRLTERDICHEYLETLNDSHYMRFSQHKNTRSTYSTQIDYLQGFDFSSNFLLAISTKQSKTLVATATIRVFPELEMLNIGFLVLKKSANQGKGKEILRQLSTWVFDLFPEMTQQIGTHRKNLGMQRVALEADFQLDTRYDSENYIYFFKQPPFLAKVKEILSSDFHIVASDVGGALHISALAKALIPRASTTLNGPAVGIFAENNPYFFELELTSKLIANKKILLGSGFYGGLESKALDSLHFKGNHKIVLLDHWMNYSERFGKLPDEFYVTNSQAEMIAREHFPTIAVRRIPDFLTAEQMRKFLSGSYLPEYLVFTLEKNAPRGEGLAYQIANIQEYLPLVLDFCRRHSITKVLFRNHPSQASSFDLNSITFPADIKCEFSTNSSLVDDLLRARVVFGFHSSALYASAMMGIETYSFFAGKGLHWTNLFPDILEVV
jgi:RimJ/RimL family protein N-acetyltransferase